MSRRALRWENVRGPKPVAALLIGTALGAGLFPIAPGTMGSLVAIPLAYVSNLWDLPLRLLLWTAIFVAGTWSAKKFDQLMGSSDNQNIVVDEVVGLGISAWTAGTDPKALIAAFLLFRLFDVIKIPPVRQLDQWSKIQASRGAGESSAWWGGFGVMADDVLAGFQALVCVILIQKAGWLH